MKNAFGASSHIACVQLYKLPFDLSKPTINDFCTQRTIADLRFGYFIFVYFAHFTAYTINRQRIKKVCTEVEIILSFGERVSHQHGPLANTVYLLAKNSIGSFGETVSGCKQIMTVCIYKTPQMESQVNVFQRFQRSS